MAAIGLEYCAYSALTENESAGTFTYGTGKRGRKMIKADIKINYFDEPLYADDGEAESIKEFIDGTITINQDSLTDTMKVDFFGNTTSSVTIGEATVSQVTSKDTDVSPFVGVGYIEPMIIDKVRKYRAVFLTKVQFAEPDESAETKGKTIAWQTPIIVGTIMRRNDGAWKEEATVDSLATAIAYLKSKVNLT